MQAGGVCGDQIMAGNGWGPDQASRSVCQCKADIGNQKISQNEVAAAEGMQSVEPPPNSGITVILDSCTIAASSGIYAEY